MSTEIMPKLPRERLLNRPMDILDEKLLSYSIQAADSLLLKARYSKYGVYWRIGDDGRYYGDENNTPNSSLYYGVSGILLLILETYRFTRENKYLAVLNECSSWLYNQCMLRPTTGFYGGRAGVIYTLIEIYKTTGDGLLLDKCNEIILNPQRDNRWTIFSNLFNGVSGELLGLIHILFYRSDKKVWRILEENLKILFDKAKTVKGGIYWDVPWMGINNLSFTNGNIGIAYALNELWLLTGDTGIHQVVQKVNTLLRTSLSKFSLQNSWNFSTDLICSVHKKDAGNCYHKDDASSHIHQYQKNENHSNFIESGLAGTGLFTLEQYIITSEKKFLESAYTIAEELFNRCKNLYARYQPLGLFTGTNGIAYFFIKLLTRTRSVINPSLNLIHPAKPYRFETYSNEYWLNKSFSYTVLSLKTQHPEILFQKKIETSNAFNSFSEDGLKMIIPGDSLTMEILKIELAKDAMEERTLFGDFRSQSRNLARATERFKNGRPLKCSIRINPNAQIHGLSAYAKLFFQADQILICRTSQGTKCYPLKAVDVLILDIIKVNYLSANRILLKFLNEVDYSTSEEKDEAKQFFIKWLREYASMEIIYIEQPFLTRLISRIGFGRKSKFGF